MHVVMHDPFFVSSSFVEFTSVVAQRIQFMRRVDPCSRSLDYR